MRHGFFGDEELRAVGVRTTVRHRQHTGTCVFELWIDLVAEAIAGTTRAPTILVLRIATEWIARLNHKVRYDAVETHAIVHGRAHSLLRLRIRPRHRAGSKTDEIRDRLRRTHFFERD